MTLKRNYCTREANPGVAIFTGKHLAIRRLAISESRHSNIGKIVFDGAMVPIEKKVAEFLRKGMKRGTFRTGDPKIAAMQFLSLLDSEFLQRILLGIVSSVKPDALNSAARRAMETFLTGYARH